MVRAIEESLLCELWHRSSALVADQMTSSNQLVMSMLNVCANEIGPITISPHVGCVVHSLLGPVPLQQ